MRTGLRLHAPRQVDVTYRYSVLQEFDYAELTDLRRNFDSIICLPLLRRSTCPNCPAIPRAVRISQASSMNLDLAAITGNLKDVIQAGHCFGTLTCGRTKRPGASDK